MKLSKLRIKNFRCFQDVEVDLNEKLTVFIAENGQGKSTVLDAIRIGLWPFVSSFDAVTGTMSNSGIDVDDVHLARGKHRNMEPQLPARIEAVAKINGQPVYWARQRDKVSKGAKTTVKDAKPIAELGARLQEKIRMLAADNTEHDSSLETPLPIVAYYGTGRLWKQRYLTLKNQSSSDFFSRTSAYVGCLDSGSDYKHFADWFFYLYASDFEQKTKEMEVQGFSGLVDDRFVYADLMQAIRRPVDQVLGALGWKHLSYSPSQKTLVMNHDDLGTLKVDQLSDGLKSMIAMTADIAYRCVRLNPYWSGNAAEKTTGVVMIDEVDMHLHPRWQQVVLGQLQEAFPQVQFIVTTHSPQVLSTTPAECIRILASEWDEKSDQQRIVVYPVTRQTQGVASSDLLAEIMGTDPLPNIEIVRQLSHYMALIQQDLESSDEANQLRSLLEAHYGKHHPHMLECDRLIRLQALKRRKSTRRNEEGR